MSVALNEFKDTAYVDKVKAQLVRYENLVNWLSSYESLIKTSIMFAKYRFHKSGIIDFNELPEMIMESLSLEGMSNDDTRESLQNVLLMAVKIMLLEGG